MLLQPNLEKVAKVVEESIDANLKHVVSMFYLCFCRSLAVPESLYEDS